MIQLKDVTLTHPDGEDRIVAVDNASLTVEPGTVGAITGPSGSGKSSLLAVASTLVTPDSGSVTSAGVETTTLSRDEAAAPAPRPRPSPTPASCSPKWAWPTRPTSVPGSSRAVSASA